MPADDVDQGLAGGGLSDMRVRIMIGEVGGLLNPGQAPGFRALHRAPGPSHRFPFPSNMSER